MTLVATDPHSLYENSPFMKSTIKNVASVLIYCPPLAWAGYIPPYSIVSEAQNYDVQLSGGFTKTLERRIRIDTPQGVDQYGQAKLYYDSKRDKLDILEAYTIRSNGEKVSVSPERIKRLNSSADDVAPYFSDEMTAVIIFPQVEVGGELYYKAVLEVNDPVIKGRFRADYPFTPHRRYESATIRLTHPADMQMQVYERGVLGKKTVLPDGRIQYLYQYKQDSAYPLEPNQVSYEDFSPVVQFSNYQGYADLAKITNDLFEPKTRVTPNVQSLADKLTEGLVAPRQKAQRLYDWVSQNIRYVGIDVGASGFEPHDADSILANRYGDCKDHAVILESLLMAVGIPSSPVLINMRESYVLPQLAGKGYFDHVITYVPQFDLYLDSTAQFADFGVLHPALMGKPTLIVQTGEIHSTPKTSPKHDYTVTRTNLRLMPDGSIVGTSNYEPHGFYTVVSRIAQFNYENKDTQTVVDSLLQRFQETGTGDMIHGAPTDLAKKWTVGSRFKLDPVINLPGPSAFAMPAGLTPSYIRTAAKNKPYTDRRYPYECGSSKHMEYIELAFPPSIKVSRIPDGRTVVTGNQAFRSTYRLKGNKLLLTRELSADYKADVCKPSLDMTGALKLVGRELKADIRSQIFVE